MRFGLPTSILAHLVATLGLTGARPIEFVHGRHSAHAPRDIVPMTYTKSGPGRKHKARKPRRRLAPAQYGGNWKGIEYLTYREHDRVNRLMRDERLTRDEALQVIRAARP